MYVCKPGLLMRVVCWLLMLAVLPEVFFCLYMLGECAFEERTFFLGGALIFGALFMLLFWRLVVLGAAWLEYDDEKVVFHLSRRDEQIVPWTEIPSELVQVQKENGTIIFQFLPGEEYTKKAVMKVSFGFNGYRDFRLECERRQIFGEPLMAKQIYEEMAPYLQRFFDDVEKRSGENKQENK